MTDQTPETAGPVLPIQVRQSEFALGREYERTKLARVLEQVAAAIKAREMSHG